jgi:hypothetical protein
MWWKGRIISVGGGSSKEEVQSGMKEPRSEGLHDRLGMEEEPRSGGLRGGLRS